MYGKLLKRDLFLNVNFGPCNHSVTVPVAVVCISFEIKCSKLKANSNTKSKTGLVSFFVPISEL